MNAAALAYVAAFVGAPCGVFVYDVSKLVRRDVRRKRKLAQEITPNGEENLNVP
jgi:hypothetical protein